MKVGIYTLGCKVNAYESEYVMNLFKERGYVIAPYEDICDICANMNKSTNRLKETRDALLYYKKYHANDYTNDTYWYFGIVIEGIEAGNLVDLSELNFNTVSTANVVLAYSSHCKIFLGEKIPSTYLLCQIS